MHRLGIIIALAIVGIMASPRAPAGRSQEPPPPQPAPPPSSERGRLERQLGSPHLRHAGEVLYIRFDREGRSIITGGEDGHLRVWDSRTGELRRSIPVGPAHGHLCYASNGRLVAGGAIAWPLKERPGELTVWNVRTGDVVRRIPLEKTWAQAIALSDDEKRLFVLSRSHRDSRIEAWDLSTGRRDEGFSIEGAPLQLLDLSRDGRRLAGMVAGSRPGVWNASDGAPVEGFAPGVSMAAVPAALALSPDGSTLACAEPGGEIHLLDTEDGEVRRRIRMPLQSGVASLAWHPGEARLAVGEASGRVHLLDTDGGDASRTLAESGHAAAPGATLGMRRHALAFSPSGDRLASSGGDGTVEIWDVASGEPVLSPSGHASFVSRVRFIDGGRRILSAGGDGTVRVWDARGEKAVRTLALHAAPILAMDVTSNGEILATAAEDGPIRLTRLEDGAAIDRWDLGDVPAPRRRRAWGDTGSWSDGPRHVQSLALHPNGQKIFTVTSAGECLIFDRGQPRPTRVFEAEIGDTDDWWRALAFEARTLPASISLRTVRQRSAWLDGVALRPHSGIWASRRTHRSLHIRMWSMGVVEWDIPLPGFAIPTRPDDLRPGIATVRLHPLVDVVVVGDTLGGVRMLDIWTGTELVSWEAHPGIVTALAVSFDGSTIATAGPGGTIRLWDGERGDRLEELAGHEDGVLSLDFSPDARALVSGGVAGLLRVWDVTDLPSPPPPPPPEGPSDLEAAWGALELTDARQAHVGLQRLVSDPAAALPFLKERLQPTPRPEPGEIARWMADLSEGPPEGADRAYRSMLSLGDVAGPHIQIQLRKSPDCRGAPRMRELLERCSLPVRGSRSETLRRLRGVQALERLGGSEEARSQLRDLSRGARDSIVTLRAKEALHRLKRSIPGVPE